MNYFGLFSIIEQYEVDNSLLHQKYLALQLQYHPDNARNEEQRKNNLIVSMDLNKAYKTLKDDILRAEYLLSINNIDINSPSLRDKIPTNELKDIWQAFENIEEISDIDVLKLEYQNRVVERKNKLDDLRKAFKANRLDEAIDILISLKYLNTLIENMKLKFDLCK